MEPHVNSARYWNWASTKRRLPFLRRSLKDSLNSAISPGRRSMEESTSPKASRKRRRLNPLDDARGVGGIDLTLRPSPCHGNASPKRFFEINVVEILSLSAPTESQQQPSRVSCVVAIYCPNPRAEKGEENTDYELLHLTSELGTVQTTVDDAGHATTKVKLEQPFKIPYHQLCVNQVRAVMDQADRNSHLLNSDDEFRLSQDYTLQVKLERVGRNWPPLELHDVIGKDGEIAKMLSSGFWSIQDLQLFAKGDLQLETQTEHRKLALGLMLGKQKEMTGYQLMVTTRWSSFPSIPAEIADDERAVVTYTFEDETTEKEKTLNGFKCIFCLEDQHSQPFLLFHLTTCHPSWTFMMTKSKVSPFTYSISVSQNPDPVSSNLASEDATLQLGPTKTPFNLDKYVAGDKSWVLTRKGISDHSGLASPTRSSVTPSLESQRISPFSSQNTELDTDDASMQPKRSRRKKLVVPKTDKPLYDILSRRMLVPGEAFSESEDDQISNALQRKHADIINDFSDVSDEEKDYIIQWDNFIRKQNITANCYFAPALLNFLEESESWFREKDTRPRQFGLHLSKLALEGTVTVNDMARCTRRLKEILQ